MNRVTADARSDHHWQSQTCKQSSTWWSSSPPLMFSCNVAALSRWSAGRLDQLIGRLNGFGWSLYTFPSRLPRYGSPAGLNLESMGPGPRLGVTESLFSTKPGQFTYSQFFMMLERWHMSWLKQYNFICHFRVYFSKTWLWSVHFIA